MQRVQVRLPAHKQEYEIKIDADLLSELGRSARVCLGEGARRAAIISNKMVFDLYGERAVKSLRASGFKIAHWLMNDGEQHKSLRSLEKALFFLSEAGLERGDAIVALGGGVVGDIAGFAAAVYLRGIAFIQVPTTLLAQIDASVGGKTGVNMPAGKNLVGAFHQPKLVLIDTETLRTLPRRELTSGWCEAVKQGAAGDRRLFDQTVRLLRRRSVDSSLRRDQNESQTEICGTLPRADDLAAEEISAAIKLDKKSVSGIIKWVLLERIGRARIVSGNEIDKRVIRSSMRAGLKPLR